MTELSDVTGMSDLKKADNMVVVKQEDRLVANTWKITF